MLPFSRMGLLILRSRAARRVMQDGCEDLFRITKHRNRRRGEFTSTLLAPWLRAPVW